MVIRVSDNNSRFDVARADDGNAEAAGGGTRAPAVESGHPMDL